MKKILIFAFFSSATICLTSCTYKSDSSEVDSQFSLQEYKKALPGDPRQYYSNAEAIMALDSSRENFLSSEVPRNLGTRISMTTEKIDRAFGNYVQWRSSFNRPPSRLNVGHKIISGATYSFGIQAMKDLIEDIEKSDQKDNITGIRIQLYEKQVYGTQKTNMIDALIVPVDIMGIPVPNANFPKRQEVDPCEGCLTLNVSNPCPDNCN